MQRNKLIFGIMLLSILVFSSVATIEVRGATYGLSVGDEFTLSVYIGGVLEQTSGYVITSVDSTWIYGDEYLVVIDGGNTAKNENKMLAAEISSLEDINTYEGESGAVIEDRVYGGRTCSCVVLGDEVWDRSTGIRVEHDGSGYIWKLTHWTAIKSASSGGGVPSYDVLLLIGIISVVSVTFFLLKKRRIKW